MLDFSFIAFVSMSHHAIQPLAYSKKHLYRYVSPERLAVMVSASGPCAFLYMNDAASFVFQSPLLASEASYSLPVSTPTSLTVLRPEWRPGINARDTITANFLLTLAYPQIRQYFCFFNLANT